MPACVAISAKIHFCYFFFLLSFSKTLLCSDEDVIPCTCTLVMPSAEKQRREGTFTLLLGVMCLLHDVQTTALNQGQNISDIWSEKEDGDACLDPHVFFVFLMSGILRNHPDCGGKHIMQAGGFWLLPQSPGWTFVAGVFLVSVFLEIFVVVMRGCVIVTNITAAHSSSSRSKIASQMQNSDGQNITSLTAGCRVHKLHHFHQPVTVELDVVHYCGWWSKKKPHAW